MRENEKLRMKYRVTDQMRKLTFDIGKNEVLDDKTPMKPWR